jgi:hypothetical protein
MESEILKVPPCGSTASVLSPAKQLLEQTHREDTGGEKMEEDPLSVAVLEISFRSRREKALSVRTQQPIA